MYLCYLDESGTPELNGNTSHFILAGLAIPIWHWKDCERELAKIRHKYDLNLGDMHAEIHTAWLLRIYLEQTKIAGFSTLSRAERRLQAEAYRREELLKLQKAPNQKDRYKQTRKNFRFTNPYVHLTFDERKSLVREIAVCVSNWGFARLFAECIDKINYPALNAKKATAEQKEINEQALEQVVSRFEKYLSIISSKERALGLLIHDNNETVCKKHTALMKRFHSSGTLWTNINHIVETPLFVNSELTSMVQIADLCAYALRRYLENQESELFDLIFVRADRKDNWGKTGNKVVGVRHYSSTACACKICQSRK